MQRIILAGSLIGLLVSSPAWARKPTAKEVQTARAHFKQARAFHEAGAWDDAVKEYEKAHALMPLPDLLYNIGQAYRMKGDKPKAIEAYQRYLAVVSEGALAEEARGHVATLKLRIQLEEAEAAKRQALAEAEAARRRAREAEETRRRAEADAARRLAEQRADQERLRRIAIEEAQRMQRRKELSDQDHQRQVVAAQKRGGALRGAGITFLTLGSLALAGVVGTGISWGVARSETAENNTPNLPPGPYETGSDGLGDSGYTYLMVGFGALGGVCLITGIILHQVGLRQRRRALGAVERSVTVLPLLGPGTLGLTLRQTF